MKKLIEYADESGVEIIIKGFSYKPSLSVPHDFTFYVSRCFGAEYSRFILKCYSFGIEWVLDL
jgi:hypothetical protein